MSQSPLEGRTAGGSATIRDGGPRGMIAVKGDLGDETLRRAATDVAGAEFPETGEARVSNGVVVVWMAPDEVLVLTDADAARDALRRLRAELKGLHVLVEDVSDMRAIITIEGHWRDILARLTPADVSHTAFPTGRVRRTRIGEVAAAFWSVEDGRAEVVCFRSVADYAFGLLAEAASGPPLSLHDL